MTRTRFNDVAGLPDPLAQYNFDLFMHTVPGVEGFDAREFKTQIMTTSIPGRTIEPIPIDLHGVTVERAGRTQYTRTLQFEMLETRRMQARRVMRQWQEYCRNDDSGGTFHAEYSTNVDLLLYDDKRTIIETTRLYGCWLETFDDAAVDGASSAAVTVSGTLKYDNWKVI